MNIFCHNAKKACRNSLLNLSLVIALLCGCAIIEAVIITQIICMREHYGLLIMTMPLHLKSYLGEISQLAYVIQTFAY